VFTAWYALSLYIRMRFVFKRVNIHVNLIALDLLFRVLVNMCPYP
jgi:hypothetical protein